jgi:hypothetical protein
MYYLNKTNQSLYQELRLYNSQISGTEGGKHVYLTSLHAIMVTPNTQERALLQTQAVAQLFKQSAGYHST